MTHTPTHLNDPDFDQPTAPSRSAEQSSFLGQLPPKVVFIGGMLGSLMVLFTIGFFILLWILLKGNSFSIAKSAPVPVVNQGAPSAANPQAQAPTGPVPPVTKADHVRGSGDITFIEYSDIECPFCKRFHPTMLQVMNEYKGKVVWVYRHFPLSFHANAQKEAEASDCVAELGGNAAFWTFTDYIFDKTTAGGTGFALDQLPVAAKAAGVDVGKFTSCLDSGKYAKHVQEEMDAGAAAGVQGTPGNFVVNLKTQKSQVISGAVPFSSFQTAIDAVLGADAQAAAPPAAGRTITMTAELWKFTPSTDRKS